MQGDTKQGGEELADIASELQKLLDDNLMVANSLYHHLITQGISRESARMVLPMCTRTRLFMKGSIRSWIHYIQVRTHPDTQKEHRHIADMAKEILLDQLPQIKNHLNHE